MKHMTAQRLKGFAVLAILVLAVLLITNNRCPSSGPEVEQEVQNEQIHPVSAETQTAVSDSNIEELSSRIESLEQKNSLYKEEVSRLQMELEQHQQKQLERDKNKAVDVTSLQDTAISTTASDVNYHTYTTSFEDTLRNCLGPHCFDQKPEGYSFQTVGLLAPPSSGAEEILETITKSGGAVVTTAVHLEYSTHVPAYGYGKNHGWSRIIRLVRHPIAHALTLLQPLIDTKKIDIASQEGRLLLDTQVRQLVRWQCRLSHVAAHTKMLTVFVDEVIKRPYYELEKIITFSGIKMPERQRVIKAGKKLRLFLKTHHYRRYENVSAIKSVLDDDAFQVAVNALGEELVGTGFLTKWPCRSFRSIHAQASVNDLLPVPAAALAANCSDSRVTCSVGFDRNGG